MKEFWAHPSTPPCGVCKKVVEVSEAEAEIENARNEGWDALYSLIAPYMALGRETEYKRGRRDLIDEIAFMARKRSGEKTSPHLHDADVYQMAGMLKGKPGKIERLNSTDIHDQLMKLNEIVESVNDLTRRMNEISPGNRP